MTEQKRAPIELDETTDVSTPADLETNSFLDWDQCEKILYLAEKRAANRASGRLDAIVVTEPWATDYDIVGSRVLFVGTVEDHSDKAYKLRGAFEIDVGEIDSVDDVDDTTVTSLVEYVDETDTDFHNAKGEMFIPRSAVDGIFAIRP